ncbi:MAG: glycosyltransferase family 2 protein [Methanoregula sp.]|nr:glycosyltransferase family 2 protein [Methanoregula sp.]
MPPLVSVVVVNFNGKKFLDGCLSSLEQQTFRDFEVILVDNRSSDGSTEFVRERYPSAILVETGKNLGFAGGTNAGIRMAQGEFIFTLNNDAIADPRMLEEIVKPVQADPGVGMCGTKMMFPDGRINSTAICLSRSGAAWDRGMGEPDRGQYDTAEEIFGPSAGAALYRRRMLDDIGLFDEDFFLFMEDVDLAFRGRLAGWKCRYAPTARVVHIHGGTAGSMSDLSVYYGNRNLVWYVVKNFPPWTLVLSSPWIMGRRCAVLPYYLFHGRGRSIIRATTAMIKGLPAMARKRRDIQRKVAAREIEKWIMRWSHASKQ